MRSYHRNMWLILLILGFLVAGMWGCAGLESKPKATLLVVPAETALTPALLKKPFQFRGSGFAPNEFIVVDLMVPKGVTIKSVPPDEDAVGLAFGYADEQGNFSATMGPLATLNWLLQVGYTPKGPDFKQVSPLPPGKYEIRASGAESEAAGLATLTILPPPKKE